MKGIKLQFFALFLVLSLLVFFLDSHGFLTPVRSVAEFVLAPVEQASYSVRNSIGDAFSFLTFWKSGEERIKNLEQRNVELTVAASREKAVERENQELRKQLGVSSLSQNKQLAVKVLGVGQYMTINQGFNDGLQVGQSVVYLDNLVGQIFKVDSRVSFVKLLTDAQLRIPVKVGSEGAVRGITLGQFGSSIILDQVAQDEQIKKEDLIYTSGDGGNSPPDLVVGKIERITSAPTDLFQKADVKPLVNYDELSEVFVIIQ